MSKRPHTHTEIYSTGPIENAVTNNSTNIALKTLNNSNGTVEVTWKVFSLNGTKVEIFSDSFTVQPKSSTFRQAPVANEEQFEAQVRIKGHDSKQVLVSVFGIDVNGENAFLNPSHRVLNSEMTKIKELD